MAQPERFAILILGSGKGGKLLAWDMARAGRRTAVVERRYIGGSCPNINCLPSKNEIWSAKVAYLVHHAAQFGTMTGPVAIDMATVRQRKRNMVDAEIAAHLQNYVTSGAELIMGSGRFVALRTLEVRLNDGGTRVLVGDQVFLNVGTHATIPSVPGLEAAQPLTNIEALDLDYVPPHLIVLGGGYVGLELGQAYRRFGSRVTVIERGPQLMSREDPDVSDEVQRILSEEGIQFLVGARVSAARVRHRLLRDERGEVVVAHPPAITNGASMKFLCLGYFRPEKMAGHSRADPDALMDKCRPHLQALYASGHLVVDAGLVPEVKSMRRKGGKVSVVDGPFTETKELVGGVFIIEARDMDEAVRIAGLHPTTQVAQGEELGSRLEIRPIHHFKQGDSLAA
jgi:hypothetical protein